MHATSYALGLGANRGWPRRVLERALVELERRGVRVVAQSRVIETAPLGPGARRYANAAAIVESGFSPPELLALVKQIERAFGRRPGRRWGDRALDIDLLLWSGGRWRGRALTIPHPALARRRFALVPLVEIAPDWRVPPTWRSVRHLTHAVDRRRPRP